jgi:hypothetical protein
MQLLRSFGCLIERSKHTYVNNPALDLSSDDYVLVL